VRARARRREIIAEALARGRNAVAIWQDLVDDHGFPARYLRPHASLSLDRISQCRHNDHMERHVVGARELKTRLGRYLRRVREGHTVLVTDRGEPIAELRPLPADTSVPAAPLKLSRKGAVTLPVRKAMVAFRPIQSRGRALSDVVVEDREERF